TLAQAARREIDHRRGQRDDGRTAGRGEAPRAVRTCEEVRADRGTEADRREDDAQEDDVRVRVGDADERGKLQRNGDEAREGPASRAVHELPGDEAVAE